MVGCYGCDYSRKIYPILKELVNRSNANFIFLDYPVKVKTNLMNRVGLCVYQQDPANYWKLNDILFTTDKANLDDAVYAQKTVTNLGLDTASINQCVNAPSTAELLNKQLNEVINTNFYGTPTVFINGKAFVGPKPYRVYAIELRGLLYWLR
jgi:protein-disulfide isomerase